MRRNHRLTVLGVFVAMCLVLTACGSRRPLSDFVAASKGGQAGGNGIQSFGGSWHVVKGSGASHSGTTTGTTTTTSSSTSSTYSYPGY